MVILFFITGVMTTGHANDNGVISVMGVFEHTAFVLALIAQLGVVDPPAEPANEEAPPAPVRSLVPFPHPLITEVLFAVPGSAGDANGDGRRHATGDEFIELTNPHPEPISLTGYRLTDRHGGGEGGFSFTFPELMLRPGETVVVFNGFEQQWSGPVGDSNRAPPAGNDRFHGARVFTARASSKYIALTNTADFVLLSSPHRVPIQVVVWGQPDPAPPADVPLIERVTNRPEGSVQRGAANAPLEPHPTIDGKPFSPGVPFVQPPRHADDSPTEQPAPKPGS